jgi:hypothetical protein
MHREHIFSPLYALSVYLHFFLAHSSRSTFGRARVDCTDALSRTVTAERAGATEYRVRRSTRLLQAPLILGGQGLPRMPCSWNHQRECSRFRRRQSPSVLRFQARRSTRLRQAPLILGGQGLPRMPCSGNYQRECSRFRRRQSPSALRFQAHWSTRLRHAPLISATPGRDSPLLSRNRRTLA